MKKITSLILILILFIGCKGDNKGKNESKSYELSLRQEWFPSACYAGDLIASELASKSQDFRIIVREGSEELDPIKMVLSGEDDIGVSSLDRIVEANNKGAGLLAIGVVNYKSPTCFVTLKKNQLSEVEDFKKYKVGVFTGNNTEMIYQLLLNKYNINREDINEIEAGWDLNSFINGVYEVRPSFVYDELVSLEAQNIKYNVLYPSDFDINFIGPVYFTRATELENNREKFKKFIDYTKKGWSKATNNPQKGIDLLKEFSNDIDTNREFKSLVKAKEYFSGEDGKILFVSENKILEMGKNLVKLGIIENENDIFKSIDLSLVTNE